MDITEVRIKLMDNSEDRLRAFCSITFDDCFVIRDLKIIEGNSGPFVAMPSRKLSSHCRSCNSKNHLRSRFCNQCGKRLNSDKVGFDDQGRAKLYADIAHPINAVCREQIQSRVISEFYEELERAKQPGYISRYDDDYDDLPQRKSAPKSTSLSGPHTPPTDTKKTEAAKSSSSNPKSTQDTGAGGDTSAESREKPDGDFGRGIF